MSNIHILPSDVVSRIAAGEVIERPASVVKELVENAIDAGATRIRVNAEQGGQRLIQVIDNGSGMGRDDALLCLETHATSKITENADVGQISTLGFRGEAIPSIAAVSRFVLQTRRPEDDIGTEIIVDYGAIRDVRPCGCAPGTHIRVSQLFGNLPARRKFLKSADTEDSHIEEMMLNLALARPDLTISLHLNGREQLRANASADLGQRVAALLGKDTYAAMLPVSYSENGITVRGFITKPGFTRSSRREQRIIVNGRSAAAETIFFAIRDAYDTLVTRGRYPGTVLYLDLAPERVDVNVHPSKREVRFREPREVSAIVAAALRRALRSLPGGEDPESARVVSLPQPPPQVQAEPPLPPTRQMPLPLPLPPPPRPTDASPPQPWQNLQPTPLPDDSSRATEPAAPDVSAAPEPQPLTPILDDATTAASVPSPPTPSPQQGVLNALRLCGHLGQRHILAESPNGLVVIDLRAAQQRIVFERLLKALNSHRVQTQPLLLPVTLNLTIDEARFLRARLDNFADLGFILEPFGGNSFLVTAVPASFPNSDVGKAMRDILDDLRRSIVSSRQNTIHVAQAASRHAIQARDRLTNQEIQALIHDLAATAMPYACPNGKPTMVNITYAELEKRFMG
ncbi:MAG: DNA mismatch repair endonuclease MutL [Lentisphaerae bacterium]|nr:DNA mismatch repair endonuclease MutL [Lentisphaerota bacterium]